MKLNLPAQHKKYLLAMSGGVDSTVLFHLLLDRHIEFEVAHANFHLRETDSNEDEKFIRFLCNQYNIPLHVKSFDVKAYKDQYNASTQMAARSLRYKWFYKLLDKRHIDYILTAHHLNDSMETFIINLTRGTGIKGLTGIQSKNKVLRPLNHLSKTEIFAYANKHLIEYRHDLSNDSDDYQRNYVRHHIIPQLYHLNIDFDYAFDKTLKNLNNEKKLLSDYIDLLIEQVSYKEDDNRYFSIKALQKPKISKALYHIFNRYGFNHKSEVLKLMDAKNSAEIQSEHYRLIKNRDNLILSAYQRVQQNYKLDGLKTENLPIPIQLKKSNTDMPSAVSFDYNTVKFPLSLRLQKSGDMFYPKGMKGKSKKVSKFYKDIKLSKIQKENTWLLCDTDDNILWVIGYRQDERFLPTKNTKLWLIAEG